LTTPRPLVRSGGPRRPWGVIELQGTHHHVPWRRGRSSAPSTSTSYWPSKAPADYRFWTHHWKGPERVIFGHTVFDRPLVTEHAVGIDTGCVYGRTLTAVVLPTWELVSVPARSTYRGGKDIALLPVHGDVNVFS